MRFFMIEQDQTLPDCIQFRDFDICGVRRIFFHEDAEQLNDSTTLYLAEKSGETAPDFIMSPVYMVSDTVKRVFDMYEDDMIFKPITIIQKETGKMYPYYHLLLKRMDMFSEQTEYYDNGSIKRLVLDSKKIGEHKVFALDDKRFLKPCIRLEVLESLLRRRVIGIKWKEIEVI